MNTFIQGLQCFRDSAGCCLGCRDKDDLVSVLTDVQATEGFKTKKKQPKNQTINKGRI